MNTAVNFTTFLEQIFHEYCDYMRNSHTCVWYPNFVSGSDSKVSHRERAECERSSQHRLCVD